MIAHTATPSTPRLLLWIRAFLQATDSSGAQQCCKRDYITGATISKPHYGRARVRRREVVAWVELDLAEATGGQRRWQSKPGPMFSQKSETHPDMMLPPMSDDDMLTPRA